MDMVVRRSEYSSSSLCRSTLSPPRLAKGIECDNETGHIHMLQHCGSEVRFLSGYNIGIISLPELKNMEYLDLSYNAFGGSQIPQNMGSFKSLRYLNLSHSSFCGVISYELGNLSKLEYLDLSSNDLGGTIHSLLGKLTRLRYLDLSYNYEINGEVPYQLGNHSQLRCLDLTLTSLSGITFQVGNLPILHTLELADNLFEIIDSKWLSSLSSLTSLDLSYLPNIVSSPQWRQMIGNLIPNLRELRLADQSLSDDNVAFCFLLIPTFPHLSILDLSQNMLTSSTFQLLFNYIRNLQELYLSQNNIVLSCPQFPNFPSLVTLISLTIMTSLIFQETFNFHTNL
ncbi:hypothetical protein Fmac_016058 [Flemingia macrophylla]|uniref:Uncharacterized protein n=1 Tax=Flemingia macrophylla TaxID=520843 RepID=A0ABD1MGB1_9FABA